MSYEALNEVRFYACTYIANFRPVLVGIGGTRKSLDGQAREEHRLG
jgi:hypothetical protein